MSENTSFPQIPTTVWWGVRNLLNKSPRANVSDDLLGVELGVQPAAARQYVGELKRAGILNEEGKATELAHRWRMPDTYADAVSEILEKNYGEGLRTIAPDSSDRGKAIDWFQRQGLGEGSARNKAATYFLIASAEPGEAPLRNASSATSRTRAASTKRAPNDVKSSPSHPEQTPEDKRGQTSGGLFPINLNLQIHISADASTDQIEAIFSSMRKHLGDARIS